MGASREYFMCESRHLLSRNQSSFLSQKIREKVLSSKQLYCRLVPAADIASVLDLLIRSTSLLLMESLNSSECILHAEIICLFPFLYVLLL